MAAVITRGTPLCAGHSAAISGRLVRLGIKINDYQGDVLDLLKEAPAPSQDQQVGSPTAQGSAASSQSSPAAAPLQEAASTVPLDPAAQCECQHSRGAHTRGFRHGCAFCDCKAFREWVPQVETVENALPQDLARALEMLAQQPGFRDLDSKHIAALGQYGRRRYFASGSILLDWGDASDRVFLILSGSVQAELPAQGDKPARTLHLGPGEIVGTRALLRRVQHVATMRAVDDLYVHQLTRERLELVFRENKSMYLAFSLALLLGVRYRECLLLLGQGVRH